MIWPIVFGALILLALLGRVAAQSGYDRAMFGARPSLFALVGIAFLCAIDMIALSGFLPDRRWIGSMVTVPIPSVVAQLFLALALSFPLTFPAAVGMPLSMAGGFVVGRMKRRRAAIQ